ncbi:MAG: hypothetical protein ABIE47_13165 [Pseudomonadota bacterium]
MCLIREGVSGQAGKGGETVSGDEAHYGRDIFKERKRDMSKIDEQIKKKIREVVLKAADDLRTDKAPVTGDSLNGLARLVNSLRKLEEKGKQRRPLVPREEPQTYEDILEHGKRGYYESLLEQ